MKTKISSALLIIISFIIYSCTESSNPVIDDSPVIEPITNTWSDETNNNYQIFFRTFDSTVTRGVFDGKEFHPDGDENRVYGFFDKTYVEFDVIRPGEIRVKFKGNFINSNRMEISSSEGDLNLVR